MTVRRLARKSEKAAGGRCAISVRNASVVLDGREILSDISWELKRGEHCFILGPNGAGKTTLMRMLLGYVWPRFGAEISVLGETYGDCDVCGLRRRIGWVSPFLQSWTGSRWKGLDVVMSGFDGTVGLYRRARPGEVSGALRAMALLGIRHLAETGFEHVSSGEQVKLLIARALVTRPEIIILDEACVHLDIAARELLLGRIAEFAGMRRSPTIIFITQRIEDLIPAFEKGMIMRQGRIVRAGIAHEILTEETLSETFGIPLKLFKTPSGRFCAVPA